MIKYIDQESNDIAELASLVIHCGILYIYSIISYRIG